MTSQEQHDRLFHRGAPCICPPDWPRDIGPASCRTCYQDDGIDKPSEQCRDHVTRRLA